MKTSNVQYVGFLLVIMTMFYVLSKVEENRTVPATNDLFTIGQAQVGRIRLSHKNEIMDVIRLDSVWVMVGSDAAPLSVDSLSHLKDILTSSRETLISSDPAKWGLYGVDDSAGVALEIFARDGTIAGHIIVGKLKYDKSSSYIRAHGTNEVYLASAQIHGAVEELMSLFEPAEQ